MYGQRIKELREEKGLTQAQLAELMHCKQRTISRYELEEHEIVSATIVALCHIFEVSADYLLGMEDDTGARKYR